MSNDSVPKNPAADPPAEPPSEPGRKAPYERLDRLEVRLRSTQITRLESMARRLTRERRSRNQTGPRLNKSSLIRAAVDVLLEARGAIHGDTEAEIADSLRDWLTANPAGIPPETRATIREARRQLTTVTDLLDHAIATPPAETTDAGENVPG